MEVSMGPTENGWSVEEKILGGDTHKAEFTGPDAEKRAKEYLDWKYADLVFYDE